MDLGVQTSVPPIPDPEASVPQFSTSGEASDRQPLEGPDPEGSNDASIHQLLGQSLARCPFSKHLKQGRFLKEGFFPGFNFPNPGGISVSSLLGFDGLEGVAPFLGLGMVGAFFEKGPLTPKSSRGYSFAERSLDDTQKRPTASSFNALVSAPGSKRPEVYMRPKDR